MSPFLIVQSGQDEVLTSSGYVDRDLCGVAASIEEVEDYYLGNCPVIMCGGEPSIFSIYTQAFKQGELVNIHGAATIVLMNRASFAKLIETDSYFWIKPTYDDLGRWSLNGSTALKNPWGIELWISNILSDNDIVTILKIEELGIGLSVLSHDSKFYYPSIIGNSPLRHFIHRQIFY